METNDKPNVVENATDARQGRTGKPVLAVLAAALILAGIAWAGAEFWGESTDPSPEQTGAAAQPDNSASSPSPAPTSGTGNTAPTETTPHSQSGTGGPVPTSNPSGTTSEKP